MVSSFSEKVTKWSEDKPSFSSFSYQFLICGGWRSCSLYHPVTELGIWRADLPFVKNTSLNNPESWSVEILAENIYPGLGTANFSGHNLGFLKHSSGWKLHYKSSFLFFPPPPRYCCQTLCTWRFFFPIIELFLTQCARNLTGSTVGKRRSRQEDLSLSDTKLMDPLAVPWTENKTFQAENCIVYVFALFPKYFWLNHLLPTQGNFAPSTLDELLFFFTYGALF